MFMKQRTFSIIRVVFLYERMLYFPLSIVSMMLLCKRRGVDVGGTRVGIQPLVASE